MAESANEIISVNIEDELKNSYLDYAMSVIVGRALPDVRDGLKPVLARQRQFCLAIRITFRDESQRYGNGGRQHD